ncbi:disease resistance protein RPV1-like isoform X2 [Diospyros lotus]|nr:disease resistance protein RPV1-like isoform X2 [Diospyros lotus]
MHLLKGVAEGNSSEVVFETNAFARMCKLRLLQLNFVQLSGSFEKFPKTLRWLCWHGFPFESIHNDFRLDNVVALDMRYSRLKNVWDGRKCFSSLKILNLSHSHFLAKTPDFSLVPNLETLILKDCVNLAEVYESIGNLKAFAQNSIQGLHEVGIFSTFFPGGEVPDWFSNKSAGSTVSFTVCSLPNCRFQGLNFCCVYALSNKEEIWWPPPLFAKSLQ